jgi:hypothetical protein
MIPEGVDGVAVRHQLLSEYNLEIGDQTLIGRNQHTQADCIKPCGQCLMMQFMPLPSLLHPFFLQNTQRLMQRIKLINRRLAFVHAETSTGALSDAEALCRLAKAHDCLTIVDAVTSLGGCELNVDQWGIDAIYSGSQNPPKTPLMQTITLSPSSTRLTKHASIPADPGAEIGRVNRFFVLNAY